MTAPGRTHRQEINDAVAERMVILLPVGSTEQHGPHLPLDVDNFLATNVCLEAAQARTGQSPGRADDSVRL